MEIKYSKDFEYLRGLFEKVIAIPNKLKQVKHYFKKYLDFETKYGNAKTQNQVRKKAVRFVSQLQTETEADAEE